jgi:hypothetical protein
MRPAPIGQEAQPAADSCSCQEVEAVTGSQLIRTILSAYRTKNQTLVTRRCESAGGFFAAVHHEVVAFAANEGGLIRRSEQN